MIPQAVAPPRLRSVPSLGDRLHAWRDRLLASPGFHRWAARFPPTRAVARRQAGALFDLCAGYVYAQVLAACVELRVFPILAEGPLPVAELASRLALPRDSTERLVSAAVSLRLLERRGGDRIGLGMLGAASLGNPGIAAMVQHGALLYRDLADPVALLRRGRGPGTGLAGFWPYAAGAGPTAESAEPYSRLMAASQPLVADQILDAYAFAGHRALLDVGGGDGTFLSSVARRHPGLALVLFDLPEVAALARERFGRDGIAERATVRGGSFLADALPEGCDVATLVRVIHDHDDGPALRILRAVRAALPPGGTLLLAEPMSGTAGAERVGDAYFAFYLMAMGSGRARSAAELAALMRQAGFADIRPLATSIPLMTSLLVARVPRLA